MKNFQSNRKKPNRLLVACAISVFLAAMTLTSFSQGRPASNANGTKEETIKVLPLSERIGHTDQSKANPGQKVHDGAGTLYIQTLLGNGAISGLNFMHHGPLMPKSSIGHHFHFDSDEMFLILDGDCEFTVNGKTAMVPGPVGVPCPAGNSHAVYNPSNKPVDWVNFNVRVTNPSNASAPRGFAPRNAYNISSDPTGTFNLGDDRVGVKLEKCTFLHTSQLNRSSLRPFAHLNGGKDTIFYRRALGPSAFVSNWAYVDHYMIPAGASIGRHFHAGVDEVYLVIKGKGLVLVNDENAQIAYGDAIPVRAKEIHSIENNSTEPLELIVYGVALEKGKLDVSDVNLTMIKLQMFFQVDPDKFDAFEKNYTNIYVPALRKQVGYMGSKLLRIFPENVQKDISAANTNFNYEMELMFDTEAHRQLWTKTKEHDAAWPATIAYVKSYQWIGYDVAGMDQVADPLGSRSLTTEDMK